ncbi:MAG: TonB-dependent receptor [Ignavibacteriales bacterium]|nr:TonB-dependent receptor [Ignavibacteriales bacterium]
MIKRYSVLCTTLSILISLNLLIAGTTGKISGKVTDSKTGDGIPSAIVTVIGSTLGAATDANGNYVIVNVPPGTYSVSVSYIGYQSTRVNNVGVNVDYTTTLNIQLRESAVELGEFVVEGERNPLIRQDQTNPVIAVTSENIQALPVTSISEVIGLQAGVVTSDDGALHVRGGRSNEISFTLNGKSVNNPYENFSSIGVATNAVQEVTVSTGTFSAEYGNALSGVVNYVTKEGGAKNTGSFRVFSGDYYSNNENVFSHIKDIDAFNNSRVEATFGGPTFLDDLTFYASGVYDRGKGYLYGTRLYNTTDFYVTRDEFTERIAYLDSIGNPFPDPNNPGFPFYANDPRLGRNDQPYYFNPLNRSILYQHLGFFQRPVLSSQDSLGAPSGDGGLVSMNPSESYNIQGNITYRISSTMKIKYEAVYDNGKSQSASSYYNSYRFNPDGRPTNYSNGLLQSLDWTHTLSNSIFYTVKLSVSDSEDKTYTYENLNDPRYLPAFYQTPLPIVGFLTGGTYLGRTFRTLRTIGGKFDLQAQLFEDHEVKFGVEVRRHELQLEDYAVEFYDVTNPKRVIQKFTDVYSDSLRYAARKPDAQSGYTFYKKEPLQFSAYIQDKIELESSLILNAGVRYEYFDPSSKYNPNLSSAIANRENSFFLNQDLTSAKPDHTISPRVSIAYPITDQGVIRFSYGHFYQIGNLQRLYTNNNFRVADAQPIFGNAEVKPQRSVQYEIGLQQGLTPDLRLELVGFYKDVRDYIFRQIVYSINGRDRYEALTNLDYSNTRGITISLYQRRIPGTLFSSSIDYTFSVAEGNRTEPREDFFFSEKSGKSAETFLVPVSFDRTHVLNASLNFSEPDDFSISNILRLQSGAPYTASIPASLATQLSRFIQNSSTKPLQWSVDLKAEKYFMIEGLKYSLFLQVDNIFDVQNEIDVYSNSGDALYNANQVANPTEFQEIRTRIGKNHVGLPPLSTIDKYYLDPRNVSRPRLVRFGLSVIF